MTEPAGAPGVELTAIEHAYDSEPILRGIDLGITSGESLALLGPSGCGKTTLLRVIAGLERPAAGSVAIGDRVVVDERTWVPPEKRRVGMVFQDWALFPHLSVAANVGYGLPRSQRAGPAVDAALDMVGLGGLGDRMPATLSGGQQQRVALARALAPQPGVLLLDEPFSNLDTTMRLEVRSEVHRLLLELGITSVFVTHDQEEAFVVGDRVAVMLAGEVVQVDTPHDLYRRPVDRAVAEFVGLVSIMRAEVHGGTVDSAFGAIPVNGTADGAVDVLLRPEQLAIVEGDSATVELVEFYGHDAMVYVDVAGQSLQIRTEPEVRVRRGDRVGVRFRGREAVAFAAVD